MQCAAVFSAGIFGLWVMGVVVLNSLLVPFHIKALHMIVQKGLAQN